MHKMNIARVKNALNVLEIALKLAESVCREYTVNAL